MRRSKNENHYLRNAIIACIGLVIAIVLFTIAPDYTRTDITSKTNLIINNSNVTEDLKEDLYIDGKGVIYVSMQDIENFFDSFIYVDEQYNQIITTSDTKVAALPIGKKSVTINGYTEDIAGAATKKDETYYLPFSEMSKVYNIEIEYIKETDRVVVVSNDRELIKADASKDLNVKWKKKGLSRTVDHIKQGDKVVIISTEEDGWNKVRTQRGYIGYVKTSDLANKVTVRENLDNKERIDGKVSLVWDYYSEYAVAPNRRGEDVSGINVISPSFFSLVKLGQGEVYDNAGSAGESYVSWAKSNNLQVWPIFTNDSMIETTHEILNDYNLRQKTIQNILAMATKYHVDGINLDFENMYEDDKDMFTRFVIELYPRLKEYGMSLSVDVTAPDGSPNWSLCFDRYNISRNCDYLIFMAYDQYGSSDTIAGPTAAYDWVKVSLDKLLRDIPSEKIILGIPFYTRTWEIGDGVDDIPYTVAMRNVKNVIPADAVIEWKEEEKQNYSEYYKNGSFYKIWIEDEKSIEEKLNLVNDSKLAGAGFWVKDFETDRVWDIIKEKLM